MATPSSHRPRKKTKKPFSTIEASADLTVTKPTTDGSPPQPSPAFPLVAFFWSARGSTSQWLVLPLVLIAAGLFRWAVGLWGFSGMRRGHGSMVMIGVTDCHRRAGLPKGW